MMIELGNLLRNGRSTNGHPMMSDKIRCLKYLKWDINTGFISGVGGIITQGCISYMQNRKMKLLLGTYLYVAHNAELIG